MSWKPVTQAAPDSLPVISDKKSSLQLYLESDRGRNVGPLIGKLFTFSYYSSYIMIIAGLEYIVEIQSLEAKRNTIFKCLLCDYSVDTSNGMKKILDHLDKLSHKLHYLVC